MGRHKNNYKAIDFFCGGGGMTCGLRQAGIDVIAGVDFDGNAKETYEFNNPGSTFIYKDIKNLWSNYFERNFDVSKYDDNLIMVGCSPCQYYSIINTDHSKAETSRSLLINFARFIEYYRPGYVLVENVPGIVGFGKACQLAAENLDEHYEKLSSIRDELIEKVLTTIPEAYLNGSEEIRLPNLVNFRFKAIEGESLILLLDAKGYQASTGSACSSNTLEASPVLTALGLDPVDVHGSLRISLAPESDAFDVDEFVNVIAEAVKRLRQMSPLWNQELDYDNIMCRKHEDNCRKC